MGAKYSYFQFQKDFDIPLYVAVDEGQYEGEVRNFLEKHGFSLLKEKEAAEVYKNLAVKKLARLLTLERASLSVCRQIDSVMASDKYGMESIVSREGYKVYRYKGEALIVYSHSHNEWKMGVYPQFSQNEKLFQHSLIINRFLSWALAPMGIVGFWGVPVEEGLVVLRQDRANGEAVFVDLKHRRQFSMDGARQLPVHFKVLRLDKNLRNRNIRMSVEELMGLLTTYCTYFDDRGQTVPVRQMIRSLSCLAEGLVHPKESFKARTNLSL